MKLRHKLLISSILKAWKNFPVPKKKKNWSDESVMMTVEELKTMAKIHWITYLPKMYQTMISEGTLEKNLTESAEQIYQMMTKEVKNLMNQGIGHAMAEHQARELHQETRILLDPEDEKNSWMEENTIFPHQEMLQDLLVIQDQINQAKK